MPMLYESKCHKCGEVHTYIAKISNYQEAAPMCCDERTQRYFSPNSIPLINASTARVFENYKCPETGQIVTSDRQRNNIMATHDLIDARETGTGKEHIARANKKQAAKDAIQHDSVSTDWTDLKTT